MYIGIDKNQKLVSTSGSGLGFYNLNTGVSETFRLKGSDKIDDLNRLNNFSNSANGQLIITAGRHIVYYDPIKHEITKHDIIPSNEYLGISYEQDPEKVWVAQGNKTIFLYSPSSHSFKKIPGDTTTIDVTCILPDKKGNIVVTTYEKGITIFSANGTIKKYYPVYTIGEKKRLNHIVSAFCDDKNNIWISDDNGFQLFDPISGKTSYPSKLSTISNEIAVGINQDKKGNLWIVYPTEIIRFSLAENSLLHFGKEMGLGVHEMLNQTIPSIANGTFFIKSIDGIVVLKTQDINPSMSPPKIGFSGIKLFNKTLETDTAIFYKKLISLNYNENSLEFEYSAFDYTSPKEVNYYYQLEGLDTSWTDVANRTEVRFTNLDPGYYTLLIKCKNSFGISNIEPCKIHILITPPFWRTNWFYILTILVLTLIIYSYIKQRESRLKGEKNKLEVQVTQRTAEVISQKAIIEQKNKEVTNSIFYAKKIQQAVLPSMDLFTKLLGDNFILFKPKDIVSGDFFWIKETEQFVFYATVDCTGHGVPGGFMCMLGSSLLNEIVDEDMLEPSEILNQLRDKIILSLKQTGNSGENKDGMDMLICRIDKNKTSLTYAAANNSLYLIRNNELEEYKANKMPIGYHIGNQESFTQHLIELKKGDVIYTFTDGYADQFGGPKGKKFKYLQFENLLLEIHQKNIQEQNNILNQRFESWRGDLEQLDDVLVIGLSI